MAEIPKEQQKCYECYIRFARGNPDFGGCKPYQDYQKLGYETCPFITSIKNNLANVKSGAVKRGKKELTLVAVVEKLIEEGF